MHLGWVLTESGIGVHCKSYHAAHEEVGLHTHSQFKELQHHQSTHGGSGGGDGSDDLACHDLHCLEAAALDGVVIAA
jgi:hypothetical protein